MPQVNVLEAKNNLSRMLRDLEEGREDYFVIARNGTPVARVVPYEHEAATWRLGVAAGEQLIRDGWDLDSCNDEVAELFGVS